MLQGPKLRPKVLAAFSYEDHRKKTQFRYCNGNCAAIETAPQQGLRGGNGICAAKNSAP